MAKFANPGEMRTKIYIKRRVISADDNGFTTETLENIYGEGKCARCKWVNSHGSEVFSAQQYGIKDAATLTMRYSPAADDQTLLVLRDGDETPYEIVSINNVEDRCRWMEINIQRRILAK